MLTAEQARAITVPIEEVLERAANSEILNILASIEYNASKGYYDYTTSSIHENENLTKWDKVIEKLKNLGYEANYIKVAKKRHLKVSWKPVDDITVVS